MDERSSTGAVSAAGRALGFQRVTAQASRTIKLQLDKLVEAGELVCDGELFRST
jgi:hypothetical protein